MLGELNSVRFIQYCWLLLKICGLPEISLQEHFLHYGQLQGTCHKIRGNRQKTQKRNTFDFDLLKLKISQQLRAVYVLSGSDVSTL